MKSKIKAIGFDFDGTLIMSEDKKAQAMVEVFQECYEIKKGVKKEYQKLIGSGMNRDEKVKSLTKTFLKREPTKKELKLIANHFGQHYQQSLNVCPLFQCTNIIKELKKQVKFIFLLSLENKKEVKQVAKHCGLSKYFDEILGGPNSKLKNFEHVLKKHHLKPNEVIYIGDSNSDVIASKKEKIKVVLINKKFHYKKIRKELEADFTFSSLCEIPKKIDQF
jgi:phosphoglycolate phosphatase